MSFFEHRNSKKYRTICETLREIETKFPETKELTQEAIGYAKKMDRKLVEYKEKFGAKDYLPEVFTKPTKEKRKITPKTLFGTIINYWDLGTSKIIGRFQTGISLIIMLTTLLAVYGLRIGAIEFLGAIILLALIGLSAGIIYRHTGLYAKEVDKFVEMNPYYTELLERVKNIEGVQKESLKQ
jgi:hypothetical protein